MVVKDSNGNLLEDGGSARLTKDLDVKGASLKLKRGSVLQKIRFVDGDPENIECRIGKTTIFVKTCFLVKA